MTSKPTMLSSCTLPQNSDIRRVSPRPATLRNATYEQEFDWRTLFYDVYRAGKHVVFQGPPLSNFLDPLKQAEPLKSTFAGWFPKVRHIDLHKRGEIWWRSDAGHVVLDTALGHFDIAVQSDMADIFANKRVLLTLSKNNAPRWIKDWITFHTAVHGADAVLLYDNNSSIYSANVLEADLQASFPHLVIRVIAWPFPYGPSGGLAGAVNGVETDWDSDFCQTGTFQHARFRFLRKARSVLNADIDELVIDDRLRSIFEVTEQSRSGFVKFAGQWISVASETPIDRAQCRHADFVLRDSQEQEICPPKWCVVPNRASRSLKVSWSVHNLFGARANRVVDTAFTFRHFKSITDNWKYDRWGLDGTEPERFHKDETLVKALKKARLL